MIGHAHDGDAKLRKTLLEVCLRHKDGVFPFPTITIDHSTIQLCLPQVSTRDSSKACESEESETLATSGSTGVGAAIAPDIHEEVDQASGGSKSEAPIIPIMYIGAFMDWLHIAWRLRRQFLEEKRNMFIGRMHCGAHVFSNPEDRIRLGLTSTDLDPSDKQNYVGTMKLFDFRIKRGRRDTAAGKDLSDTEVTESDSIRTFLWEKQHYGEWLFINFGHHFLRIFVIKNLAMVEIIKSATYCNLFIGFWVRDIQLDESKDVDSRWSKHETLHPVTTVKSGVNERTTDDPLVDLGVSGAGRGKGRAGRGTRGKGKGRGNGRGIGGIGGERRLRRPVEKDEEDLYTAPPNHPDLKAFTIKLNCLSSETRTDVMLACQSVILTVILFREQFPSVRLEPSRLSSRFSEYGFQELRSVTKTSNKVDAYQFTYIHRAIVAGHTIGAMSSEEGGLPTLHAKRGKPHSIKLCMPSKWSSQPSGFYPTDHELQASIKSVSAGFSGLLSQNMLTTLTSCTFTHGQLHGNCMTRHCMARGTSD